MVQLSVSLVNSLLSHHFEICVADQFSRMMNAPMFTFTRKIAKEIVLSCTLKIAVCYYLRSTLHGVPSGILGTPGRIPINFVNAKKKSRPYIYLRGDHELLNHRQTT